MAKKDEPVTTSSLAQPHPRELPPLPERAPLAPAPAFHEEGPLPLDPPPPPKREGPLWRIILRHTPLTRFKTLPVQAPTKEAAWQAYQEDLRRLLLSEREGEGGKRAYTNFREWLQQQDTRGIPHNASIQPEDEYQQQRAQLRALKPQIVPKT